MKKIVPLLLSFVMIAAVFAACGGKKTQSGTVTPGQGFNNAGYVEIECTRDGTCEFTANDASVSANITWEAYTFSQPFEDGLRYIPQASYAEHASFSSEGTIPVKRGDYLYIYCSENAFTADSADDVHEDASLTYTIR